MNFINYENYLNSVEHYIDDNIVEKDIDVFYFDDLVNEGVDIVKNIEIYNVKNVDDVVLQTWDCFLICEKTDINIIKIPDIIISDFQNSSLHINSMSNQDNTENTIFSIKYDKVYIKHDDKLELQNNMIIPLFNNVYISKEYTNDESLSGEYIEDFEGYVYFMGNIVKICRNKICFSKVTGVGKCLFKRSDIFLRLVKYLEDKKYTYYDKNILKIIKEFHGELQTVNDYLNRKLN